MAKAKARSTGGWKWTCLIPECGESEKGHNDIEEAANSSNEHYMKTHAEMGLTSSFMYENLDVKS